MIKLSKHTAIPSKWCIIGPGGRAETWVAGGACLKTGEMWWNVVKLGGFTSFHLSQARFLQNSMIFSDYAWILAYFLGNSKTRWKSGRMCCGHKLPSQKLAILINSSILAQYCGIRQESRGNRENGAISVGRSCRIPTNPWNAETVQKLSFLQSSGLF